MPALERNKFVVNGPCELDLIVSLVRGDQVEFELSASPTTSGFPYECSVIGMQSLRNSNRFSEYHELKLQQLLPRQGYYQLITIHYSRKTRKGIVVDRVGSPLILNIYKGLPQVHSLFHEPASK
jgi:hypothetical protein